MLTTALLRAATDNPAGDLKPGLEPSQVSPGLAGFLATFFLVAAVIGSAVLPTLVANAFYLPRHLLPRDSSRAPWVTGPGAAVTGGPGQLEPETVSQGD